jgi:transposase
MPLTRAAGLSIRKAAVAAGIGIATVQRLIKADAAR